MKDKLIKFAVGVALALGLFSAPAPAEAAPTLTRIINVTYCWSLTTFGPNGCNAQWPTEPLLFTGGSTSGTATYGPGTTGQMIGSYKFTNAGNNLKIEFLNPEPGIARVTYTGARYSGGGPNCYRGPMLADMTVNPDPTGVWFGCIQP